jgi:hypothetical protein
MHLTSAMEIYEKRRKLCVATPDRGDEGRWRRGRETEDKPLDSDRF